MSEERAVVVPGPQEPAASSTCSPPAQALVVPQPDAVATAESSPLHQLAPLGQAPILDFSAITANLPTDPVTANQMAFTLVQNNWSMTDSTLLAQLQARALEQDSDFAKLCITLDTKLKRQEDFVNDLGGTVKQVT